MALGFLGGAMAGLGQGMQMQGAMYNKKALEEAKAVREENLMRLGVQLNEESAGRMDEQAYQREVARSPERRKREVLDRQAFGEEDTRQALEQARALHGFTMETADDLLDVERRKLFMQGEVAQDLQRTTTKALIKDLGFDTDSEEAKRITSMVSLGSDIFANKEMSPEMLKVALERADLYYQEAKDGQPRFGVFRKAKSDGELRELAFEAAFMELSLVTSFGRGGGFGGPQDPGSEGDPYGIGEVTPQDKEKHIAKLQTLSEGVGGNRARLIDEINSTKNDLTPQQRAYLITLIPEIQTTRSFEGVERGGGTPFPGGGSTTVIDPPNLGTMSEIFQRQRNKEAEKFQQGAAGRGVRPGGGISTY